VNQTFNIEIKVENVNNLYSFEFKLSWNPSILNCTDEDLHPPAEWGNYTFVWPMNKWERIQSGLYVVAVTALSPAPPFSGNASLVTLTFKALNTGNTVLHLYDTILGDYPDANEIPHTTTDGMVTVSTQEEILLEGPFYTWYGAEYWIVQFGKRRPVRLISNYY
jgi:hypothetical protein